MSRPEMSVRHDVTTIGETMVAFVSRDGSTTYQAIAAGAESNVARTLAGLGLAARWVSRLGDDPLGAFIERRVAESGADVAAIRDPDSPTGVMTKHISASTTASQYYRSQSAARGLSPADLERAASSRWIHVTGITPALSESAAALVDAVMDRPNTGDSSLVSFDINYRPALWPDAVTAAETLLRLARRADVVFIGDDEAEALYPASDHAGLAELILQRADQELIVKQGSRGATLIAHDDSTWESALAAPLVDATGAGDAFAAGYLAGRCLEWPSRACLRLGHLLGSLTVSVLEDVPPQLNSTELEALSPETLEARWVGVS